ncbi:hypothetical protein [Sphingomonas pokkalii]|uniref:Uncharacterized protein n=1 Tax=Sphingomonas pokkalii TaxID=2175090 RepID=A0A2U0SB88_9SPHN|nr:hypothetical protein [Sphingomonas pokkalii]PVX28648.1 hypothetical protein DD559_04300 [Sphingomonas pokkalii]
MKMGVVQLFVSLKEPSGHDGNGFDAGEGACDDFAQPLAGFINGCPIPLLGEATEALRLLQAVRIQRKTERRATYDRPQLLGVRLVEGPAPISLDQVGFPRHVASLFCDRFMCHRLP